MDGDLLGDAFQRSQPEWFGREPLPEKAPGHLADDDRPRRRHRLQARGDVWCLPHDRERIPGVAGTHLPGHHGSAVDPHAHLHDDAVALPQAIVELLDAGNDAEARVDRAQWVVLVCAWIAEVGEHAVTHPLGGDAAEALDRAGADALVGAQDFTEVLGVEQLGQRGGVDHVAHHDRHVATLCLGVG